MQKENEKALVIGAGVMGHGIAQSFAHGGFRVSLVDINQKVLDRGFGLIKSSLETMAKEGVLEHPIEEVLGRITLTTSLEEGAHDADVAIEVIDETVESKKKIFQQP